MKFKINRDEFLRGVNTVIGAVAQRTIQPICSCILITTKDGQIELYATDLEIGVKTRVKADIIQEGSICLQGKLLHDIIKGFPGGDISFTMDDNFKVKLKSGKSNSTLHGITSEDFPVIPDYQSGNFFSLSKKEFLNMITKVNIAIPVKELPHLFAPNGALLEIKDDIMELSGTDGHRIAYHKIHIETGQQARILVPKRGLSEIKKLESSSEDNVRILISENQIFFELGDTLVISRLLELYFPNIKPKLTKINDKIVFVDRQALYQAVKRVSVFAEDQKKMIIIQLEPGLVKLTSENLGVGEADDQIEAEYDGELFEVGLNSSFILDALNLYQEEKVRLELSDGVNPVYILPLDGSRDFMYFMMPVIIYDFEEGENSGTL